MSKIVISISIILIIFFMTVSSVSCSSPAKKDLDQLMNNRIEEKLKSEDTSLAQMVITQRINYFLWPLFASLFTGIFLFVSGPRTIGIAVVLASIVCIFLIITMVLYIKIIGIVGIGVLVVGIYFYGKNEYDRRLAQRDLVNSVEIVKDFVPEEKREAIKKKLDIEQSKYTKKIVKEIKD